MLPFGEEPLRPSLLILYGNYSENSLKYLTPSEPDATYPDT